jgi:hypothetical protein
MDRRGSERRSQQSADPAPRPSGDQLDVEQIMREIRSRIAQRGIELTPQQIQDLAAHRLEAILDPRNVNPTLLDQLRRGAAAAPDPLPRVADADSGFTEEMLYEGGGLVGFLRRLFRPLVKLFFNTAPLVAAFQVQARRDRETAERASERERRQTEWNALHYQILQRLVTEVSRTSIEMQALTSRVEALAGRVDFADRRVRTLESAPTQPRSQRAQEPSLPATPTAAAPSAASTAEGTATAGAPIATSDVPRRKRRRRRGRRGIVPAADLTGQAATAVPENPDEAVEGDEGEEDEGAEITDVVEAVASEPGPPPAPELPEPHAPAPLATLRENTSAPEEPTPVPSPPPRDPDTSEPQ